MSPLWLCVYGLEYKKVREISMNFLWLCVYIHTHTHTHMSTNLHTSPPPPPHPPPINHTQPPQDPAFEPPALTDRIFDITVISGQRWLLFADPPITLAWTRDGKMAALESYMGGWVVGGWVRACVRVGGWRGLYVCLCMYICIYPPTPHIPTPHPRR